MRDLLDRRTAVETVLAAVILGGVVYCLGHLFVRGYLPQPFFYEPFDIYADWFNTAFWARDPGTYDVWKTLYPPLSFVILRLIGIDSCYPQGRAYDPSAGLAARECDWVGLVAIYGFLIIDIALIYYVLRKVDRRTAIQRTICVGLGLPMLDGVERGNLVLISFLFMILAFAPVLKSARLRWLCAGMAINLKVYLIGAVIALLLKRRWRWVEGALIATVAVYLVSYALLGRGTIPEIIRNIQDFSDVQATQLLDFWYSTTYQALLSLLKGDMFPFGLLIGSRNVELILFLIPALQHTAQAIVLLAAAATWLRPEAVPTYRAINLAILLTLITTEPGGYTQIYFMLFVMMEPWKGFWRKWAIAGCYILAIPLDIPIDRAAEVARDLYFGDGRTTLAYQIMIGPFIRPLLIMTIAAAIAMVTIIEVWKDIRLQGWSTRWRFRRDLPLLPWVQRPLPPVAAAPGPVR